MAFAMVAGALLMRYVIDGGQWWQGVLLGLAAAASATLGDLGESMIKRDLGIKDMGTLLPATAASWTASTPSSRPRPWSGSSW